MAGDAPPPGPDTKVECTPQPRGDCFKSDGDYAWAVVDYNLVVRKIPDEQPILKIPVREK